MYSLRYGVRQSIEQNKKDLQLLAESGENDLVTEFHNTFDRISTIERNLSQLQDQLDQLESQVGSDE